MESDLELYQQAQYLETEREDAARRMRFLDALWGLGFIAAYFAFPLRDDLQSAVGAVFLAALGVIQVATSHMIYLQTDLKLTVVKGALRQCQQGYQGQVTPEMREDEGVVTSTELKDWGEVNPRTGIRNGMSTLGSAEKGKREEDR